MSSLAHDNDAFNDAFGDAEAERLRPLEERLRRLNWPQPPPGVRERTLEELRRQLADRNGLLPGEAPDEALGEPERRRGRH